MCGLYRVVKGKIQLILQGQLSLPQEKWNRLSDLLTDIFTLVFPPNVEQHKILANCFHEKLLPLYH